MIRLSVIPLSGFHCRRKNVRAMNNFKFLCFVNKNPEKTHLHWVNIFFTFNICCLMIENKLNIYWRKNNWEQKKHIYWWNVIEKKGGNSSFASLMIFPLGIAEPEWENGIQTKVRKTVSCECNLKWHEPAEHCITWQREIENINK